MITLVLGGTRSGKSALAESIAQSYNTAVTYIATAVVDADDLDHVERVAAHQVRRPAEWQTIECSASSDLAAALNLAPGVAMVDSLGTWVTMHDDLAVDSGELLDALGQRSQPTVVVSEEVGLAVHPPSELGRRYVDALGALNQEIASISHKVLFVVAGRAIEVPSPDPNWIT